MIAEERLLSIISAADADDREDIEIRTLLVIALKESGIDFTEGSRRPVRAGRYAALRVSPLAWRTRRECRR